MGLLYLWRLVDGMGLVGNRLELYRESARRVRVLAEKYQTEEIRDIFERIAEQYEQLAQQVDRGLLSR